MIYITIITWSRHMHRSHRIHDVRDASNAMCCRRAMETFVTVSKQNRAWSNFCKFLVQSVTVATWPVLLHTRSLGFIWKPRHISTLRLFYKIIRTHLLRNSSAASWRFGNYFEWFCISSSLRLNRQTHSDFFWATEPSPSNRWTVDSTWAESIT